MSAEKKRSMIVPPPSEASTAISGQFSLHPGDGRRRSPSRRFLTESFSSAAPPSSFSRELEPADSERLTEVPPCSHERIVVAQTEDSNSELETIPAPRWEDAQEQWVDAEAQRLASKD